MRDGVRDLFVRQETVARALLETLPGGELVRVELTARLSPKDMVVAALNRNMEILGAVETPLEDEQTS